MRCARGLLGGFVFEGDRLFTDDLLSVAAQAQVLELRDKEPLWGKGKTEASRCGRA